MALEFRNEADLLHWIQQDNSLLLSQRLFTYSSAKDTILTTGVGSGKTCILIVRGILVSYLNPDNFGLIGRDTQTNLEGTTKKDFFEICPPEMIVHHSKKDDIVELRTLDPNKTSKIQFRHIMQTTPGKNHLSGMNLGWFAGDQIEDLTEREWNYLHTRLRRKSVKGHCAFGIANPKGRDWVYKWYIDGQPNKTVTSVPAVGGREFAEVTEYSGKPGRYAIQSWTHENVHLPPGFIENIELTQSREYIQRYLYASFEEWGGKIYKEFRHDSKHVIHPFKIPDNWPTIVSIDVGGDSPWAVIVGRVDPVFGDIFITSEFYKPTVLVKDITEWMRDKENGIPDLDQARIICDPENKPVILEFANLGVMCEAARKGPKNPGIMRVAAYMQPKPGRQRLIPQQPDGRGNLRDIFVDDAPHLWVFNTCEHWIEEHDNWQWQRDARTGLAQDKAQDVNDHTCDAQIYMLKVRPDVRELPKMDLQLEYLRQHDFYSYTVMSAIKREREGGSGSGLGEMLDAPLRGEEKGSISEMCR